MPDCRVWPFTTPGSQGDLKFARAKCQVCKCALGLRRAR